MLSVLEQSGIAPQHLFYRTGQGRSNDSRLVLYAIAAGKTDDTLLTKLGFRSPSSGRRQPIVWA
jgi:hypothetical protein